MGSDGRAGPCQPRCGRGAAARAGCDRGQRAKLPQWRLWLCCSGAPGCLNRALPAAPGSDRPRRSAVEPGFLPRGLLIPPACQGPRLRGAGGHLGVSPWDASAFGSEARHR